MYKFKINFSLLLIVFLTITNLFGQSNGFKYKAVVSDAGSVLQNQAITVRFTVLENATTQVYQETHTTNTNDNGIVSVNIGEGDSTDDFNAINWSNSQFLKVEFDTGSGYEDMGTTEFKMVPKAKFADKATTADFVNYSYWNQIINGINSPDPVGIGVSPSLGANLHIKDVMGGYPLIKMESDDNIFTIWQSDRTGTDDYSIGIDGGNNRFQFSNLTTGTQIMTLKNDRVGIKNTNPLADLDVAGTFKLTDGTQGAGKVLTSDSYGNAFWETYAAPSQEQTVIYTPAMVLPASNVYGFARTHIEFYYTETNLQGTFIPYTIPAGATITQITYYYYDNSTVDLAFKLLFSTIDTGSNQSYYSATFISSGVSTNVRSETLNVNLLLDGDVNRSFYIYPVNGSWPGDSSLSFRGIKINYTLP